MGNAVVAKNAAAPMSNPKADVNAAKTDMIEQCLAVMELHMWPIGDDGATLRALARAQLAALTEQQAEPNWDAIKKHEVVLETETRMPCGHLQTDRVSCPYCEKHECTLIDQITGVRFHLMQTEDAPKRFECLSYCRSCKQQAEAVAQARLDEAKWAAKNIPDSREAQEDADNRVAELERAVKEAGR
jgi:hypothetical protein